MQAIHILYQLTMVEWAKSLWALSNATEIETKQPSTCAVVFFVAAGKDKNCDLHGRALIAYRFIVPCLDGSRCHSNPCSLLII